MMEVAPLGRLGVVILGDVFKQPLAALVELFRKIQGSYRFQHFRLQARVEAHPTVPAMGPVFASRALPMPDEEQLHAQ